MLRGVNNWERYLFATIGIIFMITSFCFLAQKDLAFFSTTFGVSFLCFLYSNLARFKRFKGLGFEAELWEDKQKEAADLIERLKNVIAVYTREIIMSKVMMGRWADGARWQSNWNLFNELVSRHTELGQQIDFAPLKTQVDSIFLFDIVNYLQGKLLEPLQVGVSEARKIIEAEFGSPVKDNAGYGRRLEQLRSVPGPLDDLFGRSVTENVAKKVIDNAINAAEFLKSGFGVDIPYDPTILANLRLVAEAADHRPIEVTPELIKLADREPG